MKQTRIDITPVRDNGLSNVVAIWTTGTVHTDLREMRRVYKYSSSIYNHVDVMRIEWCTRSPAWHVDTNTADISHTMTIWNTVKLLAIESIQFLANHVMLDAVKQNKMKLQSAIVVWPGHVYRCSLPLYRPAQNSWVRPWVGPRTEERKKNNLLLTNAAMFEFSGPLLIPDFKQVMNVMSILFAHKFFPSFAVNVSHSTGKY